VLDTPSQKSANITTVLLLLVLPLHLILGSGNGSPMATNVDLVLGVLVIRFFNSLRLCCFSTDRNETFHIY